MSSPENDSWISKDPNYPGVEFFNCGICAWSAEKPCPSHPAPYYRKKPVRQDATGFASPEKCVNCNGSGIVAGPGEYVAEDCPECVRGYTKIREVLPEVRQLNQKIDELQLQLRKLGATLDSRDVEILKLRKRLTDNGIIPDTEVLQAIRALPNVPKVGFKRGCYLWCYTVNDWVTVTKMRTPYVYCLYRGIKRTFKRVELSEAPPPGATLPGEVIVKRPVGRPKGSKNRPVDDLDPEFVKIMDKEVRAHQDAAQVESLEISDQEDDTLVFLNMTGVPNDFRMVAEELGTPVAEAMDVVVGLIEKGLVEIEPNGVNARITAKGFEYLRSGN